MWWARLVPEVHPLLQAGSVSPALWLERLGQYSSDGTQGTTVKP